MARHFLFLLLVTAATATAQTQVVKVVESPFPIQEVDAIDSLNCFLVSERRVLRTSDRGVTWDTVVSAVPDYPGGFSTTITRCTPMTIAIRPFASSHPRLDYLVSSDSGRNWEKRSIDTWRYLPTDFQTALPLAVHVTRHDSVLLCYPTQMFRFNGEAAVPPTESIMLPDSVRSMAARGDTVLLGTKAGIYRSVDAGTTWIQTSRGDVGRIIFHGIDRVAFLERDRNILFSEDGGISFDTIPIPVPPAIVGYERRKATLMSLGDGSTGRLRLVMGLDLIFDTLSHNNWATRVFDYDPETRKWWLTTEPKYLLTFHGAGWPSESLCWGTTSSSTSRLYAVDQRIDESTAVLVVNDRSTEHRRQLRISWTETDYGRWQEAVLERSHNNDSWEYLATLPPPISYQTCSYVDSTIVQEWEGTHEYQYRLRKQFQDAEQRIYSSASFRLRHDSVCVDLLDYILPPANSWLHYCVDDKRSSVFFDEIRVVNEYRTDYLLRHMWDGIASPPFQYTLLRLQEDYLCTNIFFCHEGVAFNERLVLMDQQDAKLGDAYGMLRLIRVKKESRGSLDTIGLLKRLPVEKSYFDYVLRYVRGQGLLSYTSIVRNKYSGFVDTTHRTYLCGTTSSLRETSHINTFHLGPPYPNPVNFRSEAAIHFPLSIGKSVILRATVTDMLGRVVAQLHEGPTDAGTHELVWDASVHGRKALKS